MKKGNKESEKLMNKIVSLSKRRGFVYPGSDIYGGLSNSWDFGPLGAELKNNIKKSWWENFVHKNTNIYGLDSAVIMNPKVWEVSGHEKGFVDPLIECSECHKRFRADEIYEGDDWEEKFKKIEKLETEKQLEEIQDLISECPSCGAKKSFSAPKKFNMMFKTFIGPVDDGSNVAYLRPETAQGIFVNFKNIMSTMSPKIPFGIAQIGKSFRNEITPGNFIFRTREFEQMEIEYFIKKEDWKKEFSKWEDAMKDWMNKIGLDMKKIEFVEIPKDELAHYSEKTVDIEFKFPFGQKELFGIAYRTDFDLKSHQDASGESMEYVDSSNGEKFIPHVIEPSLGVERALLALLISAYREDEERIWLDLDINMAPFKSAVFPLLKNKKDLVNKAKEIHKELIDLNIGEIAWDDRGNIGKRYLSQDEIGTPYCFTVDYQTLEDETITVRDRNTKEQKRIKAEEIQDFLKDKIKESK